MLVHRLQRWPITSTLHQLQTISDKFIFIGNIPDTLYRLV